MLRHDVTTAGSSPVTYSTQKLSHVSGCNDRVPLGPIRRLAPSPGLMSLGTDPAILRERWDTQVVSSASGEDHVGWEGFQTEGRDPRLRGCMYANGLWRDPSSRSWNVFSEVVRMWGRSQNEVLEDLDAGRLAGVIKLSDDPLEWWIPRSSAVALYGLPAIST